MERLKAQEEKYYWQEVEMEIERSRMVMAQEPAQEVAEEVAEDVAQVEVRDGVQNLAQIENQEKEIDQENGTEMENIGGRSRSRGGGTRGATRSMGSRRGTRAKKGAARGI